MDEATESLEGARLRLNLPRFPGDWAAEKALLQAELRGGRFRFGLQGRVTRESGEEIDLRSARDALVLKALALGLGERLPVSRRCATRGSLAASSGWTSEMTIGWDAWDWTVSPSRAFARGSLEGAPIAASHRGHSGKTQTQQHGDARLGDR